MTTSTRLWALTCLFGALGWISPCLAEVGVGAPPVEDAELILDGSRAMLDSK